MHFGINHTIRNTILVILKNKVFLIFIIIYKTFYKDIVVDIEKSLINSD